MTVADLSLEHGLAMAFQSRTPPRVCVRLTMAVLSLILLTTAVRAEEFDFVLLPLAPARVPGAFGSEWVTDLAVTNVSDTPLLVERDLPAICPALCTPLPLPAHATAFVDDPVETPVRGRLLFVAKGRVPDLAFTLRVRDTSRQGETWGTVVPVVVPARLFGKTFGLDDIPMTPDFRATLRVYDVDATTPPQVRVRVYALEPSRDPVLDADADTLIASFTPEFVMPAAGTAAAFPASAEIPLWLDPRIAAARIRIEVEPLDGKAEYWAFVSITQNSTQHVTMVTPP